MPRFRGHQQKKPQRRKPNPALRISGRRLEPESGEAREVRSRDPLDFHQAIEPTQLSAASPRNLDPSAPRPLVVPADGEEAVESSLQGYIERIEASAARLRAEHTGDDRARRVAPAADKPDSSRRPLRRRRPPAVRPDALRPWYRRRRTWFIVAMAIPLLFVASATAYVLNIVRVSVDAYNEIHEPPVDRTRWTVNPSGTPVPLPSGQIETVVPDGDTDQPINIVLLGVDAQVEEDQPPRSDTAIIVHVDPGTNEVSMMSIPRDLLVFIPGFGRDKFNAAYPLGEAHEDEIPGGGPTLVAQTIEANFNIFIHYYATIDFDGFREVVDTVGGVVVDVENQLSDNLYPTDDLRLTRIYFPSGLQKMDGDTALEYVRTRHADSDFGRADRQQQVLMAIREQAVSLELITRAQALIRDMQETVRTDMNFNQMLALANLGRQVQPGDIARLNLLEEGLIVEHLPEFDGDGYYLEAYWPSVIAQTRAFFGGEGDSGAVAASSDDTDPNLSISIFVENATDIPLLAGSSAQLLVEAGFTEVWPSDARSLQPNSTIQTAPADLDTARHIAMLLGLQETTILTVTGSDGITVTLGGDVPRSLIPVPDDEAESG